MKEKRYTANDWINGIIHQDLRDRKLPDIILKELKNVGFLGDLLHKYDFISDEEQKKIDAIMQDLFFRVLKHNVQERFEYFKPTLESAYKPELLLDERIRDLKIRFESARTYYREEALKGGWSKIGLGHDTYRKINDKNYTRNNFSVIIFTPTRYFKERLGGVREVSTDKYYQGQNALFDVSEIFRFREKLIEFRNTGDINSYQNDYPIPLEVAKLFFDQSKTKDTPYSIEDYAFVMKYAMENHTQGNISEMIRQIYKAKNCPKAILDRKQTNANSLRRWIEFYDIKADIER